MNIDASRIQLQMLTSSGVNCAGNRESACSLTRAAQPEMSGACEVAERAGSHRGRTRRTGRRDTLVLTLLRRPHGASVSEIAAAAGWRSNRVRVFLLSASSLPLVVEESAVGEQRYHLAALVTQS